MWRLCEYALAAIHIPPPLKIQKRRDLLGNVLFLAANLVEDGGNVKFAVALVADSARLRRKMLLQDQLDVRAQRGLGLHRDQSEMPSNALTLELDELIVWCYVFDLCGWTFLLRKFSAGLHGDDL